MRLDLHNNVEQISALHAQAITTSTTTHGQIIDTQGYFAVEFVVQAATITDGTYTILLEEGNNSGLSDNATVAAVNTLGPSPASITATNGLMRIGYVVGAFRYIRLSIISASVTSGGTLGAIALLATPQEAPTA